MTCDNNADDKSGFVTYLKESFQNENDPLLWLVNQFPDQMGNVFCQLEYMESDNRCTVDDMKELLDTKEEECRAFCREVHHPNYEVRKSKLQCANGKPAGKGLFATRDLPTNTLLGRLPGTVVLDEEKVQQADGYSFFMEPKMDHPFPRVLNEGRVLARLSSEGATSGFEPEVCKAELRRVENEEGNDGVECVVVGPDGRDRGLVSTKGAYLVVLHAQEHPFMCANDAGFDDKEMRELFQDGDLSSANAAYRERAYLETNAVFLPILRATDNDACDDCKKETNYASIGMGLVLTRPVAKGEEIFVKYGTHYWADHCKEEYWKERDDARLKKRRRTEGRRSLPAPWPTGRVGAVLPPGYKEVRHDSPDLAKPYSTFVRVEDGKTFKSAVAAWKDFYTRGGVA